MPSVARKVEIRSNVSKYAAVTIGGGELSGAVATNFCAASSI